eukprot:COSAG05_NODE_11649_length_503_cov_1.396040_1_plen_47_part_10
MRIRDVLTAAARVRHCDGAPPLSTAANAAMCRHFGAILTLLPAVVRA